MFNTVVLGKESKQQVMITRQCSTSVWNTSLKVVWRCGGWVMYLRTWIINSTANSMSFHSLLWSMCTWFHMPYCNSMGLHHIRKKSQLTRGHSDRVCRRLPYSSKFLWHNIFEWISWLKIQSLNFFLTNLECSTCNVCEFTRHDPKILLRKLTFTWLQVSHEIFGPQKFEAIHTLHTDWHVQIRKSYMNS